VDETTVFDGHTRINASARVNASAGDVIDVRWAGEEGELDAIQLPIEEDGTYPVGAWLTPDPVLPNGVYTVTYLFNGEPMQEAAVQVTGVTPELLDVIACESEPEEATCTPRTGPFDGLQPLYFVAELSGATPSDTLAAQLLRDDEVVTEVEGPLPRASTVSLPISFVPEPALMTGDYALKVYLNGELAQTLPVAVEGPASQIVSVVTCREVDENQSCMEPAEVFDGEETIYAVTEVVGMREGDEIGVRWLFGDQELGSFVFPVEQPGSGSIAFHFAPRTPMSSGDYQVEILYDDEIAATVPFTVESTAPPALTPVRSVQTCREISTDYECIEPTTVYGPSDTVYALLQVVDFRAGETITARWLGGDGVLLEETPLSPETDFSGPLYFDLTPNAPFPPGEYAVEIYYRDWLVDRVPFTVAE